MLIRKKSVFPLRSDRVSTYDRMREMREFRGGREGKFDITNALREPNYSIRVTFSRNKKIAKR